MENALNYSGRIRKIEAELRTKTLTQAEQDRNIDRIDYTDAGYGYKLKTNRPETITQAKKDVETPYLDMLENKAAALGVA